MPAGPVYLYPSRSSAQKNTTIQTAFAVLPQRPSLLPGFCFPGTSSLHGLICPVSGSRSAYGLSVHQEIGFASTFTLASSLTSGRSLSFEAAWKRFRAFADILFRHVVLSTFENLLVANIQFLPASSAVFHPVSIRLSTPIIFRLIRVLRKRYFGLPRGLLSLQPAESLPH